MDSGRRRSSRVVSHLALSALAVGILVGCSSGNQDAVGDQSPAPVVPSASSSSSGPVDVPGVEPPQELAPGVNAPKNPVQPSKTPVLLRQQDLQEVTVFAQGLADELMRMVGVFAPKPNNSPLTVADLRFIQGLSVFALDQYYSWVLDEKTYRNNADKVEGLIFIPPQDVKQRAYALPPVQDVQYTDVVAEEGPPSSVDGTPTIRVSFKLTGDLMWKDKQGVFWIAPVKRDISYVIAEQNEDWALDSWVPSKVQVDEARKATEEEVFGVQFSVFEVTNPPDVVAPLPSSFPKAKSGNGR